MKQISMVDLEIFQKYRYTRLGGRGFLKKIQISISWTEVVDILKNNVPNPSEKGIW